MASQRAGCCSTTSENLRATRRFHGRWRARGDGERCSSADASHRQTNPLLLSFLSFRPPALLKLGCGRSPRCDAFDAMTRGSRGEGDRDFVNSDETSAAYDALRETLAGAPAEEHALILDARSTGRSGTLRRTTRSDRDCDSGRPGTRGGRPSDGRHAGRVVDRRARPRQNARSSATGRARRPSERCREGAFPGEDPGRRLRPLLDV